MISAKANHIHLCKSCHPALRVNKRPKFCILNGCEYARIPSCLKNLTVAEIRMISQVYPFIYVKPIVNKVSGTISYTSKGHGYNFSKDIQKPLSLLPRKCEPEQLGYLLIGKEQIDDKSNAWRRTHIFSPSKVLTALEWLKIHNPLYKDVNIDREYLNSVPEPDPLLLSQQQQIDDDGN